MSSSHKMIRVTALSEETCFWSPTGRGLKSVGSLLVLLFVLIVVSGCVRNNERTPAAPATSAQKPLQETVEPTQNSPPAQAESVAKPKSDAAVEAADEDEVAKVVYHADFADPRRFSAMLTSINNMVTTYQNDFIEYDVRIVFVSHGIRFLTDDKLANTPFAEDAAMAERRASNKGRLLSLYKVHDVKLELCDITRAAINMPKEAFYEQVDFVTSGVVQIAKLQKQGFSYLKIE
ncbi:MAG: hypothetical protein BMS9Abin15_0919 [Gammaproteobacteria bacterium]|nr:MAG: hypothetical protein BMS9Abin15_0919 [Gammaproteobacteria bacterium]